MRSRWIVSMALVAGMARAEQIPFADGGTIANETGGIDAVAQADIDGDGDDDLIYASRTGSRVSWSRNDRSGYAPRVTLFSRENVLRVLAADFDRDGRVDLVTATTAGTLAIHRGLGTLANGVPQYDTRTAFSTSQTGVTRLAAGDISGDGRPDLVVGRNESPVLAAFLFTGGAGSMFTGTPAISLPPGAGSVAGIGIADIDSNGFNDVVLTANTLPGSAQLTAQLTVIPRTGPSAFGAAIEVETLVGPDASEPHEFGALVIGDFDLLNGPDVAWIVNGASAAPSQIALRTTTAAGSLALGNRQAVDEGSSVYHGLAAEDIDHDGDLDLAFNSNDGHVGAYVENLRTSFAPGAIASSGVPDAIATLVADDDLDGDFDLLAVRAGGSIRRARNVRIHGSTFVFGNVDSALVTESPAGPLAGTFEVATRRVARTSRREALFTEFTGGRVHAMRVERTGIFNLAATLAAAPVVADVGAAREIAVLDFDYDGDDDFVLATGESGNSPAGNQNRVTLSRNGATPVNTVLGCTQGDDIRGVAIGEIFNPGMGIAYAAEDNDRIATVTACPAETLVSTPANGVPNGPGVAKLGDLDQDGDLDLVVAARFNDEGAQPGDLVGWYPNTGNGSFGALQRIGTVDAAREAVLLDFNRDGRLDVASAGVVAGTVLLFPNAGGGLFDPPIVAATGIQAPGRVSAADLDFDGDIDLLVPSESEASRGQDRSQCGVSLIEARADGSYAAPICLDDFDRIPWSRLAVDDLDANGVADIVATSFPDSRVRVFSLGQSRQYTARNSATQSVVQLEAGVEQCYESLDIRHLGRAGDNDLRIGQFQISSLSGSPGGNLITAMVMRRDDGDGVPDPVLDAEVGRDTEPTVSGGVLIWNIAPPDHRLTATDGLVRFWTCALPAARMPATADLLALRAPSVIVRDAGTSRLASGFTLGSFVQSLRSSAVFRDGLEGAAN